MTTPTKTEIEEAMETNAFKCETCLDTGEVDTMEQVYPNEPHTAPIGTAPCPDCSSEVDDDDGELDQDR